MPNLRLEFFLSEKGLALIDELRDSRTREEFFRQVLELGLCELVETTTRMHRDYLTHTMAGDTKDYRQGRAALFQIDEPKASEKKPPSGKPDYDALIPEGTRTRGTT
jgi:hypothetical protein